eukprot:6226139-Prymnesium_polylepis.1
MCIRDRLYNIKERHPRPKSHAALLRPSLAYRSLDSHKTYSSLSKAHRSQQSGYLGRAFLISR